MQSRIEGHQNLINGVTLHLQKEKEDKIQEGHQKILEEVELHLEDVHAKYDGIISKARVIKDQAKRIEDAIVSEKKIDEMHVKGEGKPSNVKPYRHPHYQEKFQRRQEGRYQHYQGRWNTCQYSWNKASQNHSSTSYYQRPTTTTKSRSYNNNAWNQRKENHATTSHQGLRRRELILDGWIIINRRKAYYLVSSHVKPLIANLLEQNFLKEGTML
jgi:hypothetical protein